MKKRICFLILCLLALTACAPEGLSTSATPTAVTCTVSFDSAGGSD